VKTSFSESPLKEGLFDVKSFYSILGCREGSLFSWKSILRTKAPLRVFFFFLDGGLWKDF